ncbi:MAG: EAL domain-containing protein [Actinobacteria bacterium]|nr:MAG: EAL domain-containing protein [Actinomycetota bacterium]
MLCEDLHSPDELPAIAAQVVDGLAAPFDDDQQFAVTVSVGIALGEHSSNGATLLRDADAAMYRAKEEGRNRYAFFDEELRSRVLARLTTESELRAAIENNELCIHYQPVIDLHTGAIVGAEALARWQHPQRGIVGPAQFISVAEESGLVLPMGRFVLRATCNQARHWRALWPDHSLGVSVNLRGGGRAPRRRPRRRSARTGAHGDGAGRRPSRPSGQAACTAEPRRPHRDRRFRHRLLVVEPPQAIPDSQHQDRSELRRGTRERFRR